MIKISLLLFFYLWGHNGHAEPVQYLDFSNFTQETTAATPIAAAAEMSQSAGSNLANSCTQPPVYFDFKSASYLSAKRIHSLARQYCGTDYDKKDGKTILLGADQGNGAMVRLLANKKNLPACVKTHIYLEGPGGPTGSGNLPTGTECRNMQRGAKRAGVRGVNGSCAASQSWIKDWNRWGYRRYTRMQIEDFAKLGFATYEIDNEYRDPNIGSGRRRPQGLVNLYIEQQNWIENNPLFKKLNVFPKIVLKNLEPADLRAIKKAIDDGLLKKSLFSGYHIIEEHLHDQKRAISNLSAAFGVKTVTNPTGTTHDYAARGKYDLSASQNLCAQ